VSTAGSGLRALVGVGAVDGVVTLFCGEPMVSGSSIAPGLAGLSDESGAPGFARACRAGTVSGLTGSAVLFDVSGLIDLPAPAGVSESEGRSDPVGAVCLAGRSESELLGVPDSVGASD
jgi:hypothetical protein